ncbi:MAG: TIGR02996 domain-containing protein [Kofleriaceae bacterium]
MIEDLFAAVYANPDDDGPRLVLADALLERGDDRGELIQLQIARSGRKQTPKQARREKELVDKHAAEHPLASFGTLVFERGFPQTIDLDPKVKQLGNDPVWSTIRCAKARKMKLTAKLFAGQSRLVELELYDCAFAPKCFDALPHLRTLYAAVDRIPAHAFAGLEALTTLELTTERTIAKSLAGLPSLTKLVLNQDPTEVPIPPALFATLAHVPDIDLVFSKQFAPSGLAALASVERFGARFMPFEQLPALPKLRFANVRAPEVFADVAAAVARLPALEHVNFEIFGPFEEMPNKTSPSDRWPMFGATINASKLTKIGIAETFTLTRGRDGKFSHLHVDDNGYNLVNLALMAVRHFGVTTIENPGKHEARALARLLTDTASPRARGRRAR